MRFGERIADLRANSHDILEREWFATQSIGQCLALEIFHHQEINAIVMPDIMDGANVWVIQRGNSASFSMEPLPPLRIVCDPG